MKYRTLQWSSDFLLICAHISKISLFARGKDIIKYVDEFSVKILSRSIGDFLNFGRRNYEETFKN